MRFIINNSNIKLVKPNIERDAPFALGWFKSDNGKQTLLLMGNAENEIKPATLNSEKRPFRNLLNWKSPMSS